MNDLSKYPPNFLLHSFQKFRRFLLLNSSILIMPISLLLTIQNLTSISFCKFSERSFFNNMLRMSEYF